jgi:uncharacterized membrane protein
MKIPWSYRYAFTGYVNSSLWLFPFVALPLYLVIARLVHAVGDWLLLTGRIDLASFLGLHLPGARVSLDAIVTMNMSFLVFTFGSLLVAIQVASGQYTPRIIATTLLRDNRIRYIVAYFVFTLLLALRMANQIDAQVNQFDLLVAGILGLLSIMLFLYFIDHAARMLRPVSIVARVARDGLAVIDSMYPQLTSHAPLVDELSKPARPPARIVAHKGTSGVLLAVNVSELLATARRCQGVIEVVPQVGDFVAVDEPLFVLYGGVVAVDDRTLRTLVAFGGERTIDQDPTFAFRILVDIALKALSAAINDPTTAVLALDQLHRLLRAAGLRFLLGDVIADADGEMRLIFRTPHWEDFVQLTFREIRSCGAGSFQITRRLRAMGENLIQTLPEYRQAALRIELELLDRAIGTQFVFPEDQALARVADAQGLGGARRRS